MKDFFVAEGHFLCAFLLGNSISRAQGCVPAGGCLPAVLVSFMTCQFFIIKPNFMLTHL
jgi:hypothetical protein